MSVVVPQRRGYLSWTGFCIVPHQSYENTTQNDGLLGDTVCVGSRLGRPTRGRRPENKLKRHGFGTNLIGFRESSFTTDGWSL